MKLICLHTACFTVFKIGDKNFQVLKFSWGCKFELRHKLCNTRGCNFSELEKHAKYFKMVLGDFIP